MYPDGMNPLEAFSLTSDMWLVYPGYGFVFFGSEHLFCLALCVLFVVAVVYRYVHMPADKSFAIARRRMRLVLAFVPAVCWIAVSILTIMQGCLSVARAPLYLCNLCEVLVLIDALRPNTFCDESIFAVGIIAGVAALVFPGWNHCPVWSVQSVTGFIEHSCVISFGLARLLGADFSPHLRHLWMPIVLTLAYSAAIVPVNLTYATNFMFIPDPMNTEPLESIFQALGNPGYTCLFLGTLCVIYVLEYLLWSICSGAFGRRRRSAA